MNRLTGNFTAALSAGFLAGGFAAAHAAQIQQTSEDFAISQPATPPATNSAQIMGLGAFDTGLGTLTEVDLSVLGGGGIGSPAASASAQVNGGSEGGTSQLTATFTVGGSTAGTQTQQTVSSPTAETFGTNPATSNGPITFPALQITDATDLALFEGTGNLTNLLASISSFVPTNDCFADGCTFVDSAGLTGSVVIVYDYTTTTSAPEPFGLAVFATGLAGVAAMRRWSGWRGPKHGRT
jgi:hypothetical protein